MYDTQRVEADTIFEVNIPAQEVEGSDIFYRDPLIGYFTLLDRTGNRMNDFIVVGLHLASGQDKEQNHNAAFSRLIAKLSQLRESNDLPPAETDYLVGGDLNASLYDNHIENFWIDFGGANFEFDVLAPQSEAEYPGTRLAGVPLFPRSQIDYFLATSRPNGLTEKLVQLTANVHTELLPQNFNEYRRSYSDHLPITVRILGQNDND